MCQLWCNNLSILNIKPKQNIIFGFELKRLNLETYNLIIELNYFIPNSQHLQVVVY